MCPCWINLCPLTPGQWLPKTPHCPLEASCPTVILPLSPLRKITGRRNDQPAGPGYPSGSGPGGPRERPSGSLWDRLCLHLTNTLICPKCCLRLSSMFKPAASHRMAPDDRVQPSGQAEGSCLCSWPRRNWAGLPLLMGAKDHDSPVVSDLGETWSRRTLREAAFPTAWDCPVTAGRPSCYCGPFA